MINNTSPGLFAEFESGKYVPVVGWSSHNPPQALVPALDGVLRSIRQVDGFVQLVNADELLGWELLDCSGIPEVLPDSGPDPVIDWAARADGRVHQLDRGEHFGRDPRKVQRAAVMWAQRHDVRAVTRIDGDSVTVQFLQREGKV